MASVLRRISRPGTVASSGRLGHGAGQGFEVAVEGGVQGGGQFAGPGLAVHIVLGLTVAVYLDGGPTPAAVASSIVDLTQEVPVLKRAGATISVERLRDVVPDLQTL